MTYRQYKKPFGMQIDLLETKGTMNLTSLRKGQFEAGYLKDHQIKVYLLFVPCTLQFIVFNI